MADTTKILQGDPIRVIREQWHGPQGAQRLSEELYTMFSASTPMTTDTPASLNQGSTDVPALTITNTIGGTTVSVNGGDITFGGGGDITINAGPAGPGGGDITLGGSNLTLNIPPNNITIDGQTLPNMIAGGGGGGGGGGGMLGRVTGGSGSSYTVAVYGNGISRAATATVTATVPQIAGGENVPSGTYVTVVHAGNEYNFQPPVWM